MLPKNWWIQNGLLLTLVLSLFSTPLAQAQGQTLVLVSPSLLTSQPNETFNLAVQVQNISDLTAFEIHLSFNAAVLEVQQVSNGGFVAADFPVQNVYDNNSGTIDFAVAQMNRPAAQGSGVLVNITFRAKAAGDSLLSVRPTQAAPGGMLFSNQNGSPIAVSWAGAAVTVGAGTPSTPVTPTPVTPTPVTPTPVTPTPVTPTPTATVVNGIAGTHIVRFGEWLYCIGRAYRVAPEAIILANGLWWPYFIYPNQTLLIPNVPWVNMPGGVTCQAQFSIGSATPTPTATLPVQTVTPAPPTPVTPAPPAACRAAYLVQPGDTLYSIAARYGTTYTELARVNQISNPRLIYPGQQLCIP